MDSTVITKYRVKKFLKIFSLLLLFSLIGLLIYGYVRILPKDIQYSNVSSSSFTVSWTTKSPTKGAVRVIESKNNLPIAFNVFERDIYNDTRDVRVSELIAAQETAEKVWNSDSFGVKVSDFVTERVVTERGTYYTHHIQVKGLDQEKEYSVMVGDGLLFLNSKNFSDQKSIKTNTIPEAMDTPLPAYGQIKDAQNEDVAIDELKPVTDGVVYFNYLDESTQERSNVFSSSLNESGGWYVDIATAVDKDGDLFFEKYSQTITNIYGELLIDLGPLGTWKKVINVKESSPAQMIVINIPGYVSDDSIPESLIKIESNANTLLKGSVKGVNAGEDGCTWIDYCTYGRFDKEQDKWINCSGVDATLKSRKCGEQKDAQEAAQEVGSGSETCGGLSGRVAVGTLSMYGAKCMQCKMNDKGTYAVWSDTENADLCKGGGGAGEGEEEGGGGEELVKDCTSAAEGAACTTSGKIGTCKKPYTGSTFRVCTPNKDVYTAKNEVKDNMVITDTDRICLDGDGCNCFYGGTDSRPDNIIEAIAGGTCYKLGTGEGNPPGIVESSVGKTCKDIANNIASGVTNNNNICEIREGVKLLTNEMINGESCVRKITNLYATSKEGDTYKCINGEFVYVTNDKLQRYYMCNIGEECYANLDQCLNSTGVLLDCNNVKGTARWAIEEGASERGAYDLDILKPGDSCESGNCLCNKMYLDSAGEICPEVSQCISTTGLYQGNVATNSICNTDGNTCSKDGNCDGPKKNASSQIDKSFTKKLYANENTSSEYIIDTTTGKVLAIEPGLYTIRDNDESYVFVIKQQDIKDGKGDMLVYIDANENGVQDEGEKTLSDFSSSVKINAIKKSYTYNLKEGFNFITVPFLIDQEEARTAAGLLKMINAEYFDSIYSIAKYDGKWSVVGQNVEIYDNNDFQLVPGQGYIIKANTEFVLEIIGRPVDFTSESDNAPITFYPGWNLIGVYGSEAKQYTAKSLIQSINKYEPVDFTANNVSRWESDVQRYDGLQITNENGIDIEYGFDFPINTLQSYFVRILQGKGNWQPELE